MFEVRTCFLGLLMVFPSPVLAQMTGASTPSVNALTPDVFASARVKREKNGVIRRVRGIRIPLEGTTPEAQANAFIAQFSHRLGIDGARVENVLPRGERTLIRLQPTHGGVPILDGGLILTLVDGHLTALNNEAPILERVESARVDADDARQLAAAALAARGIPDANPQIVSAGIIALGPVGTPVFEVDWAGLTLDQHWVLRVDAHRGRIIGVTQRGKH
jgi:hypothetical protein